MGLIDKVNPKDEIYKSFNIKGNDCFSIAYNYIKNT